MKEREVIQVSAPDIKIMSDTDLENEIKIRRLERKAKLVTVLERGYTGDRLQVPLPPDKYGEWVPRDKMEQYRMEAMGFKVDTEYASKRALHDSGVSGESVVADCIFMVCDMETKELIDEINRERYDAANRPRGGKQREEKILEAAALEQGLPISEKQHSRFESATVDQITAALTSKD